MNEIKRNVVIIHTDEQVWTFLGCMGNEEIQTPNIDELAAAGMLFNTSYACSGVCVPSRACLLTGRYPIAHGITCNVQTLPDSEKTMGHYFSAAGYRTGYFGKTHYGGHDNDMPLDGWTDSFIWQKQYNDYLRKNGIDIRYPEGREIKHPEMRYWNVGSSNIPYEHYFEKVIADRAIDFINQNKNDPFLCFVGNIAPHNPFSPPKPYDTMYDPDKLSIEPAYEHELDNKPPAFVRWVEQNRKYTSERELRIYMAHIYGLISLVDVQVGRIVKALKDANVYDETMIIFTADHGDFSSAYGIIGKSWCMDDRLMRVPLIISHPEFRNARKRSDKLNENVDILPTVMGYCGLKIPFAIQGKSLLPLIEGKAVCHKDAVFGYNYFYDDKNHLNQTIIRCGSWKLVQSNDFKGELYDLKNDPRETVNLIDRPEHATLVSELREKILRWHIQYSGLTVSDDAIEKCWEVYSNFYDENNFQG
ncbi:MAG: sulfatase-like hydrolase/transferase [Victivallaceae bacterium]